MDSKVKALAVLAALSVTTLALLLVWYTNGNGNIGGGSGVAATESVSAQTEANGYRDFLKDDTFFDPEPKSSVLTETKELTPRLYMQADSVMKDIRVCITGEDGTPVKGYSFYINIDGLGEFKDLDKDGMIYVPDLKAGDYFVQLENEPGFVVPDEPMRVAVRDQLEYEVIGDISLYIHSEDEIDEAAEDTEIPGASDDTDETEVKTRWEGTDAAFGIDVSKWQKEIDWQKVADSGVDFAIIRCGYRGSSSGYLIEDKCFKKNLEGAKAAGIKVGVYFFSQAVSEVEAVEEASMVVTLLDGAKLDYPIFIDTESAGGNGRADGLNAADRTAVLKAFCETIDNSGYHSGIYASRCWYYERLNDGELTDITHWVAEYRKNPLYKGEFALWQYTSSGVIDGINTRVDLDLVWNGN